MKYGSKKGGAKHRGACSPMKSKHCDIPGSQRMAGGRGSGSAGMTGGDFYHHKPERTRGGRHRGYGGSNRFGTSSKDY